MKNIKKTVLCIFSIIFLFTTLVPVSAAPSSVIDYYSDGSYSITEISESNNSLYELFSTNKSKTASKTKKYYSVSGDALWFVKVTGTFQYNGNSSSCTSSSVAAGTYTSSWTINKKTSSKNGATATANATGTRYINSKPDITRTITVTLTCDKNGNLS